MRGAIRRPTGDGVLDHPIQVFLSFQVIFFDQVPDSQVLGARTSVFPLLNPPPLGTGRLYLVRRSAALARLGASWAEKGIQKLIKF